MGRELKKEVSHSPALVAVFVVAGVYALLSDRLVVMPGWLLFAVILALAIPAYIFHRLGNHRLNRNISFALLFLITLAVAASISLLLLSLPDKSIPAVTLLVNAGLLWELICGLCPMVLAA